MNDDKTDVSIVMTDRDLPLSIVKRILKHHAPGTNFAKDVTAAIVRATSIYLLYVTGTKPKEKSISLLYVTGTKSKEKSISLLYVTGTKSK